MLRPRHLIAWLALAWLAGCVTTPPKPQVDPQALHAAQQFNAGDYRAAAERYQVLAQHAQGAFRQLYRLLAADSLLQDQQTEKGKEWFNRVDAQQLPDDARFRYRLVQAQILLLNHQPETALQLLHSIPENLRDDQLIRLYRLRAQAHQALEQTAQQAQALMAMDALLQDDDQHLPVQLQILQLLGQLNADELAQEFPQENGVTRGWKELALLLKSFPNDPRGIISPYSEWRDLYPDHPAIPELLTSYYRKQNQIKPLNIRTVAVLLPASGPYARPAEILRTGIISAWYQDTSEQRPQLRFYDSSDSTRIWPLLNRAAEDGADIAIGPLAKPAILQLARAGNLPIPVLALNQVNTDSLPPRDLYQYALSPEDEAHQVAVWARYKGLFKPAVLYPDTTLGQRMLHAFIEQWQELEAGDVLAQGYTPNDGSLSNKIATLVQSRKRIKEMEALKKYQALAKKQPTASEPPEVSELPMDFIFAIGHQPQMRQIRPLLQFHFAGNLPLFSTSRAWNGHLSKQEALDLEGIMLPDIPWLSFDSQDPLSRGAMARRFPQMFGKYLRLLPMGMDAYTLLPHLRRMENNRLQTLSGRTGELYMDGNKHILRNLTWISLGMRPTVLGVTPFADSIELTPMDMEELDESLASP